MDHAMAFVSPLASGFGMSGRGVAQCRRRVPVVAMGSDKGERDCEKVRPPSKIFKRVTKARDRLLELVPHRGDFPTLEEIEAALARARADMESEMLEEQTMKRERKLKEKYMESKIVEAAATDGLETAVGVEAPIAGVQVCTGKSCVKKGSVDFLETLQRNPDEGGRPAVACKCLGKCKEPGITIKVVDDLGSSTLLFIQDSSSFTSELTPTARSGAIN